MKNSLRTALTAGLVTSALIVTPLVWAKNNSSGSETPSTSGDNTTQIETEHHTREDRIARLKTAFKVNLTEVEMLRLKTHCLGAQGVVGRLNSRFELNSAIRTKAYSNLQERLANIIAKLKAKNVDTTELEAEQTALSSKITTFKADLSAYKQALSDLKDISCKTDPNGFKAALEAARSAHATVISDAVAIRTYVVDTIKPTLQSILKTLEQQSSTNTSSGSSN